MALPLAGGASQARATAMVWGSRPLASYFILTPGLLEEMKGGLNLTAWEWQEVEQVATLEYYRLAQLKEESQPVVSNPVTPLWLKRLQLVWMGYNRRVEAIVKDTDHALQENLGEYIYRDLVSWIEGRWLLEVQVHGRPQANMLPSSRSFQVYATRYDAGGAYTVALPDKCVKFTNGGSSICSDDGYVVGQNYSVFLSYNGSTGAVVAESGPWNVDDTYWAAWNDPTPRRMFADLPLGMPEAQAAYFNAYNGGLDQFGRKVTGPYGIDLARQVSIDIGLQPGTNDWITVSYLWTEGWDNSPAFATSAAGASAATPGAAVAIAPLQLASPQSDGSVVHVVEYGQSLWQIAVAYDTTIQSIVELNQLSSETVIWPGDELLVLPPGSLTPAASAESTPAPTPEPQQDNLPPATAASPAVQEQQATRTGPAPAETAPVSPGADIKRPAIFRGVLAAGLLLVILGLILVGAGRVFFK